ncbi:serine hydrolase [Edaphobacter bradus]|uniref:serine hydrolase n=1 Tax=Edaphobacter bradus TaxID=2259016 RepID=UPI0021DFCB76|nr:serine hydrolase [Edaphobacter bradus]
MMLVDKANLKLNGVVGDYLPSFPHSNVCVSGDDDETISRAAERQITILDMLTHTSGLIYEFTGTTRFIVTIGVTV